MLLGESVKEVSDPVTDKVGEPITYRIGKWWKRRQDLLYGEVIEGFWFTHYAL